MRRSLGFGSLTLAVVIGSLALACGPGATTTRSAASPDPDQASVATAATDPGDLAFSGTREETARFIGYHQRIRLTADEERTKTEALSAIPAPCCSNNPLATCCCPCNLAKAAWGLSAWLITEKGYGAEQVRGATKEWLAVANRGGFSGDACYAGGCRRAIHQNGCGGMDDRHVL